VPARTSTRKRGRPPVEGLAQRRGEEILDAAAAIFARDGFDKADVQDIADRVGGGGVGKGTVYRYFPTKRALFLAAADRGMRRLRGEVELAAAAATGPLGQIEAGVRAYLAFFDAHPELVELLIQERAAFKDRKKPTYFEHRESQLERWRRHYRDLIAGGQVRNIPIDRITDTLGSLLYGAMFINFFAGRRKTLEAQAADILDIVFNGILAEPERQTQGGRPAGGAAKGQRHGPR
jgi:AcrR family transcriptional regulator